MIRDAVDEIWAAHTPVAGFTPLGSAVRRSRSGPTVAARRDAGPALYGVKWLVPSIVSRPELVMRLRSDIGRLSGLGHTGVAEVDVVHEGADGVVVGGELVDAIPLRDLLTDAHFTDREALLVAVDVLDALAWIHHAGVLHRDVSPDTIVLDSSGRSKLVDIGIAAPAYINGEAAGTPAYMAPEVWTEREAVRQSDLYSLGCTLYELLAGHAPYGQHRVAAMRSKHLAGHLNIEVLPESVREVIAEGLAKDTKKRVATAALWREHLMRRGEQLWGAQWDVAARQALSARALASSQLMPSAMISGMALEVGAQHPRHSRRRWFAIGGAAAALAFAGVAFAGFALVSAGGHGAAKAPHSSTLGLASPAATQESRFFPTATPTPVPSPSPSSSPSPSPSPKPSGTPRPTPAPVSITASPTPIPTPTPTHTPNPSPSTSPSATPTAAPN